MICQICREAFDGIWDPQKTPRTQEIDSSDIDPADAMAFMFDAEPGVSPETFLSRLQNYRKPQAKREMHSDGQKPTVRPEIFKYMFGHHRNVESLQQSAEEECPICVVMFAVMDSEATVAPRKRGFFSYFFVRQDIISVLLDNGRLGMREFKFCGLKDDPRLYPPLEGSTDSPTTWTMVKNWLTNCLNSHVLCQQPQEFVPSRLLKLDPARKSFSLTLKESLGPTVQYIALSYCWGVDDEKKLKLTKQNLEVLKSGVFLSSLPKTLQDAFRIAQELEIQFLWVDRLCIIQNSSQDWFCESNQMQDVYSSAFVTVCAHGAASGSDGCFSTRNPSDIAPTEVSLAFRSKSEKLPYLLSENSVTWGKRFDSPAIKRGWILQEQLLSRRILYFGRQQVFWECRSISCCETYPAGVPSFKSASASVDQQKLLWKAPLNVALKAPNMPPLHFELDAVGYCMLEWDQTVHEYSGRCLTRGYDKLIAISGLANQMGEKLRSLGADDKYHAGIWAISLPRSLLWMMTNPRRRESAEERAPSWSWAASEGNLDQNGQKMHSNAETLVSDIQVRTSTRKHSGIVVEGRLSLKGRLAVPMLGERVVRHINNAHTIPLSQLRNSRTAECIPVEEGFIVFDDVQPMSSEVELFCLPIVYDVARLRYLRLPFIARWAIQGLVLKGEHASFGAWGILHGYHGWKMIIESFSQDYQRYLSKYDKLTSCDAAITGYMMTQNSDESFHLCNQAWWPLVSATPLSKVY